MNKKIIKTGILAAVFLIMGGCASMASSKESVPVIHLGQTKGEFIVKEITLDEGTYIFETRNNGIDHPVGFVIAPKGKTDRAHVIKDSLITNGGKGTHDGETARSNKVSLKKGEYVYWCPQNPTAFNRLTVK